MELSQILLFILYLGNTGVWANALQPRSPWGSKPWHQGEKAHGELQIHLSIALALDNTDLAIESLKSIADPASPKYGQHWTAAEVARNIRPSSAARRNVSSWLKSLEIDDERVTQSHDAGSLHLSLTVHEAARLLETTFHYFTSPETGEQQISCSVYHIPESLSEHIDYITSSASVPILNKRSPTRAQSPLAPPADALPLATVNCDKYTSPSCLRELYNIPRGIDPHPNNSFGIFQPAWLTWLPADLDKFFGLFEPNLIGARPEMERIDEGYTQTDYQMLPFNVEPDLDFEYAMALTAPQKVIDIQVGDKYQLGNLNLMLAAFDKYYCDSLDPSIDPQYPDLGGYNKSVDCGTLSPPNVISISFTWSEADFPPQYLFRQCLEFLRLGLMGVTVLVSTSDWGTASGMEPGYCLDENNGVNNATTGKFNPSFPASCPWVTTVGGTQRTTQPHQNFTTKTATTDRAYPSAEDPENPTNETAFYFATDNRTLSSGGGFSNLFPAPYYQIADIYRYELTESEHLRNLTGKFTTTARGYPDVSAQAFGYLPIVDGGVQVIHGTSGSTPVFASIISMINNERINIGKGPVGFINPVLYEYPDMLNDIKTGANEGCGVDPAFRASWGWDPVTGLGTPDYERMKGRFLSLP